MLETTRRIVCDQCGVSGPEALESESARLLAQAEGWICADEDLCPNCAARANRARA